MPSFEKKNNDFKSQILIVDGDSFASAVKDKLRADCNFAFSGSQALNMYKDRL